MAILLLVSWPQLQLLLVVIGRAHSLGIARPTLPHRYIKCAVRG